MEAVGKHFRRLVGAVEVGVAPWYGVRHIAHVSVHVQSQHRACEVTERLEGSEYTQIDCLTAHTGKAG